MSADPTEAQELTIVDLLGAARQWRDYLRDKLGFDDGASANFTVVADNTLGDYKLYLTIYGTDKFQSYEKRAHGTFPTVGHVHESIHFKVGEAWAPIVDKVWAKLETAMPRDERELRFQMKRMGDVIEKAGNGEMTSEIGKMLADRFASARNEVAGHMLTYDKAAKDRYREYHRRTGEGVAPTDELKVTDDGAVRKTGAKEPAGDLPF